MIRRKLLFWMDLYLLPPLSLLRGGKREIDGVSRNTEPLEGQRIFTTCNFSMIQEPILQVQDVAVSFLRASASSSSFLSSRIAGNGRKVELGGGGTNASGDNKEKERSFSIFFIAFN